MAALDITIIATALPTIAKRINASSAQYVWVGSSYTLASTSLTPVWAKFSDFWGRKKMMILANAFFLAGSLLVGLSASINMLIAGRIVQGIGGGGLMILNTIIIGDLFLIKQRAKHYGLSAISLPSLVELDQF